jgi:hypothetical protein
MTIETTLNNVRLCSLFVILAPSILLAGGCSSSLGGGNSLAPSLKLTVVAPNQPIRIGTEMRITYSLQNGGPRTLVGCLTFKEGYDLWGSKGVKQRVNVVDHPRCQELIDLKPNDRVNWLSTITLPDVGAGSAKLVGWVQVALPKSCDRYGCDQSLVRSEGVRINVEE